MINLDQFLMYIYFSSSLPVDKLYYYHHRIYIMSAVCAYTVYNIIIVYFLALMILDVAREIKK